ncbi:uncharacterized protein M6B38_285675 [Iris pallida]|uniref:Uncharacterized protein n=1 Tax=Iris pallida TaxID=29817 RepID=A0AAX6HXJ5_IRIPA|nr:uncharacterized protein M6B38_285675 [Iris pallida]
MQPKRGSLSLLFLLSFSAIFLYSYHYHSSLHLSQHPNPNPNSFTFTIKLLTFDRIDSLRRCLLSLSAADYGTDPVHLHIFLDHFPNVSSSSPSAADAALEGSRRILRLVDGFRWTHGQKLVHYRTYNAGLQAQWLEAWWPGSDDDFAFVVEDDLELSPLYYQFLKRLILKYYYDPDNYSPDIYGASLQRPRFVAGKHGNKLHVDDETRLFLYQMVGTWGQLLFPKPWKEFRLWYDEHKAKGIKPILQGMVTTGWYKKIGERIWTPWFIKFIHSRGYYNIYTNFLHERALSTSHRDAGVNYGKTAGPDSKLLDKQSLDFNLWEMQPLADLKWYDFCFSEVHPWRVVTSYDGLGSVLGSLKKQSIILVSLYRTTEKIARNLVCRLESLGLRNFIFIGDNIQFLHDLSRRGYPVIDSDKLISSISRKLTGLEQSDTDVIKEIGVKAVVLKRSLELSYDCWMIDGNILPAINLFDELPNQSYSFSAAKDVGLVFFKSSTTSLKIWVDDFVLKVVAAAKTMLENNSVSAEDKDFLHLITRTLKDTNSARVWRFDESKIGVKIGADTKHQKFLQNEKKLVFWSREATMDSVQRDLEELDMWLIDGDLSCVSVVCHQ